MTRFLPLAGILIACSGSSPTPMTSSLRALTTKSSLDTDTIHSHRSTSKAPVCPQTVTIPQNTNAAQCKQTPERLIPDEFWCVESRKSPKHPSFNNCYSTEPTCSKLRQQGLDSGYVVGVCRPKDSAYCFKMAQPIAQEVYWRCYGTMEDCMPFRAKWLREKPELRFSECRHKGRSRSPLASSNIDNISPESR